jgi:hypothetical protein
MTQPLIQKCVIEYHQLTSEAKQEYTQHHVNMNLPKVDDSFDCYDLCAFGGNYYCAYIPLDLIKYEPWCPERTKHNLSLMMNKKTVIPIMLSDNMKDGSKYCLTDGNHRCDACRKMKYTHVPAIISNQILDEKFIIIHDMVWRSHKIKELYTKYMCSNNIEAFWSLYWDTDLWNSDI